MQENAFKNAVCEIGVILFQRTVLMLFIKIPYDYFICNIVPSLLAKQHCNMLLNFLPKRNKARVVWIILSDWAIFAFYVILTTFIKYCCDLNAIRKYTLYFYFVIVCNFSEF